MARSGDSVAPVTGPVVRVAHPQDVVAAGALTAEAYLADGLLADDDDYAAELRDAQRRAAEAVLLVAVVPTPDGREVVVGTLTVAPYGSSYAEVAEPGEVELRMLAVAPEARNRGVAARLMRSALREALTGGARRVVLSTLDAMAAAQRLYGRLGFVREPERDWGHEVVHLRVYAWTPPEAPGVLVETATWPPVRTVVTDDGWRVGVSGGFTRRANSAVPLGHPADLATAVARVEAVYDEAGLPSTVRVGSGAPSGLDEALAARGYEVRVRTDVLVRTVDEAAVAPRGDGLPAAPPGAGLSVAPDERRRGLGAALTREGLALAREGGARRAFLQVETDNVAAAELYGRLGFVVADGYRYLARPRWSAPQAPPTGGTGPGGILVP